MGHTVAEIEERLAALRDDAAGTSGLRTSVSDLVVYCRSREHADELAEVVAELHHSRPSRSLIVVPTDEATAVTSAETVTCLVPPDGAGACVCSEVIELVGPRAGGALEQMVTSLLLPDLPAFLLWLDEPSFWGTRFARLLAITSRVVTDSIRFPSTLDQLPRLLDARPGIVLGDMAWTRLTGVREVLAQLFDVPEHAALLPRLSTVRAFHEPTSAAPARLLAGWLAARSGTRPRVEIEAATDHVPVRAGMRRIELECGPERFVCDYANEEGVRTESPVLGERWFARRQPGGVRMLGEELAFLVRDPVFEEALRAATR